MFEFNHDTLVVVLNEQSGVELRSYGMPRDGFELDCLIPHWTSGYGGRYEMVHKNVPKGTMIAVADLENLPIDDDDALKERLAQMDIYPAGHSGDFSGQDVKALQKWFFDRSVRDDAVNNQDPIAQAKKLTPRGLGDNRYYELVHYLAENMNLFKDHEQRDKLIPEDPAKRVSIVQDILDGLSQAVRYTRRDGPATAFQVQGEMHIKKQNKGDIVLTLESVYKILVLRKDPKTGKVDITPLDISMMGKTYVTQDGKPLGDRGIVDLETIAKRAAEIEKAKSDINAYSAVYDARMLEDFGMKNRTPHPPAK